MDEQLNKLNNLYYTLCNIEVKGDKNIEYMYGCLVTLKNLITEVSTQGEK